MNKIYCEEFTAVKCDACTHEQEVARQDQILILDVQQLSFDEEKQLWYYNCDFCQTKRDFDKCRQDQILEGGNNND